MACDFSIIVPFYNAEKYLRECIESIVNQTYTCFELLLVDDGSTDGSRLICEEFAQKDSRITVIYKQNGGVSSARNCGIGSTRGKWLCFIDSDDSIKPQFLEHLANGISDDVQAVAGGYSEQNRKGEFEIYLPENEIFSEKNICRFYEKHLMSCVCRAPWGKLFRKSVIDENKIRFDESIGFGEDALFCLQFFKKCNSISVLNVAEYRWRFVKNSLSRHNAVNKIDTLQLSFDKFIAEFADELAKFSTSDTLKKLAAEKYFRMFLQKTEFLYISPSNAAERRKMLKSFAENLREYSYNYASFAAFYGIPGRIAATIYAGGNAAVCDIILKIYFTVKKIL